MNPKISKKIGVTPFLLLVIIGIIFIGTQSTLAFGEYSTTYTYTTTREDPRVQSSYMDGVRVYGNPTICAFEIDHEFNDQLISYAKKAVNEWERKIVAQTADEANWGFHFRTVSEAEQRSSSFMDCDMRIRFVESIPREFNEFGDDTLGIAQPYATYTDIWILYLESEKQRKKVSEDEDTIYYELVPTGKFTKYLAKDLRSTIEHEIGHGLGLDHIKSRYFDTRNGNAYAPSIMSHYSSGYYEQQIFQITTMDVENIIKYYGPYGFNSYQSAEDYISKTSEGCEGDVQIINKGYPAESWVCCEEGFQIDGDVCSPKSSSIVPKFNDSEEDTPSLNQEILPSSNFFTFPNGDQIDYTFSTGDIDEMNIDLEAKSLIVNLHAYNYGILDLQLPRSLIDAKWGDDNRVFVLINSVEVDNFYENLDSTNRHLILNIPKGIVEVEILGTYVSQSLYETTPSTLKPELKENGFTQFMDASKDPSHYIIRYYNDPSYREWFDTYFPDLTIEDAVGFDSDTNKFKAYASDENLSNESDKISENIEKPNNNGFWTSIFEKIFG